MSGMLNAYNQAHGMADRVYTGLRNIVVTQGSTVLESLTHRMIAVPLPSATLEKYIRSLCKNVSEEQRLTEGDLSDFQLIIPLNKTVANHFLEAHRALKDSLKRMYGDIAMEQLNSKETGRFFFLLVMRTGCMKITKTTQLGTTVTGFLKVVAKVEKDLTDMLSMSPAAIRTACAISVDLCAYLLIHIMRRCHVGELPLGNIAMSALIQHARNWKSRNEATRDLNLQLAIKTACEFHTTVKPKFDATLSKVNARATLHRMQENPRMRISALADVIANDSSLSTEVKDTVDKFLQVIIKSDHSVIIKDLCSILTAAGRWDAQWVADGQISIPVTKACMDIVYESL